MCSVGHCSIYLYSKNLLSANMLQSHKTLYQTGHSTAVSAELSKLLKALQHFCRVNRWRILSALHPKLLLLK